MKIRYFAHFSDDAGCTEESISGPETVMELLHLLADRHQEPMRSHLFSQDRQHASDDLFLLVNGRHLRQLNGLATPLNEEDTIAIIPVTEAG